MELIPKGVFINKEQRYRKLCFASDKNFFSFTKAKMAKI